MAEMNSQALEITVVPPLRDLGEDFKVRRALPSNERRMVGPFVFFDHFGPANFAAGKGLDVRPHPHIGLATVTYLLDGEILHRDSLETVQRICPGEVNWMTAGRGIVHSERTSPEVRSQSSSLAGLQCWVGLPKSHEEVEPAFTHTTASQLPLEEGEGVVARVIVGDFLGRQSPVSALSPTFFVDVQLQPGARLSVPADYTERAIYPVQGRIELGNDGIFDAGQFLVLKPGVPVTIRCCGPEAARIMLLGGEPLDGPRYVTWNFVSSSKDRIMQAAEDWRARKFGVVPGDPEYIPLPDTLRRPVDYP